MYAEIEKLLQTRTDMLCSGRFSELAMLYQLPFVAYHDGFPVLIQNYSQAIETLSKIADVIAARSVVRLTVEVNSVELPKNNRFRVWSRYNEIDSRGRVISQSDLVQYFFESPTGLVIEMVDFHKCPLAAVYKPADECVS